MNRKIAYNLSPGNFIYRNLMGAHASKLFHGQRSPEARRKQSGHLCANGHRVDTFAWANGRRVDTFAWANGHRVDTFAWANGRRVDTFAWANGRGAAQDSRFFSELLHKL